MYTCKPLESIVIYNPARIPGFPINPISTLKIFRFPAFLQVQDLEYVAGWKSYEDNEHGVAKRLVKYLNLSSTTPR